jgi:asparagine synthase (glutamine-hydrolysing)
MCGICGKLNFDRTATVDPNLLGTMLATIRHRGPDDEGIYVSGQVGLGFRRLSIIDLSSGHQPLSNEDGSVWVVFNGEIYNYLELRKRLVDKGHVFKTQTDTEVLVHLYEEYGENLVQELRGMFGFAIWDDRNKFLLLARDRVGIKPLYYCLTDKSLLFASEIKAILADPEVRRELNPDVIDRFLTFFYVPGEETLLKGVSKLLPGHYMTWKDGKAKIRQYWDLHFPDQPEERDLKSAEEQLISLLDETVRLHMISDVPVGFLISGGVDSSGILSLATGKTDQRISSYTVGFSEPGITDERPYARMAARAYGSEHHEMTISSKDFADFLPQYIWHMEEPVCEPPAVALYYVSKFARQFVKVLISGEGGDEAFAGYSNYRNFAWFERLKSILGPFDGALSMGLSSLSRFTQSERIGKYATLAATPFDSFYYSRTSSPYQWFNREGAILYSRKFASSVNKRNSLSVVAKYLENGSKRDLLSKMLYVDTKTWLPDDLLIKADKMTMANSLELRVPLLDHKVLEFAASLPSNFKVNRFTTKYILKKAFGSRIPEAILNRKKTGFPVPYALWLRTELKDWLRDILFDRRTLERGYFERSEIEKLVSEHQQNGNFSKEIFSLVTLELWHRFFLEENPHLPSLDVKEVIGQRTH